MKPREALDEGQRDMFLARLDQIIDMGHPKAVLARQIDWRHLAERFGACYSDAPGHPALPTRLMAGLQILKFTEDLSDEVLCARWVENPYYQYFCGEEFFQHELPFDRSSMTRWRQRMGEEKLEALLQESLHVAVRLGAAKPADFTQVIVDTTVQEKNAAFPTDAKLAHRARERLVRLADKHDVELRQSYKRVGKLALIKQQRYAHAKHFNRAKAKLRTLRTFLGRTIRDITRKIAGNSFLQNQFSAELYKAILRQAQECPDPKATRRRKAYLLSARAGGRMHWPLRQAQEANPTSLMSSASRPPSPPRSTAARAASSPSTPRRCPDGRMMGTRSKQSFPTSRP